MQSELPFFILQLVVIVPTSVAIMISGLFAVTYPVQARKFAARLVTIKRRR